MVTDEFRSPLHGILASAELFRDTTYTNFQSGLLETITKCGHTLLVSRQTFVRGGIYVEQQTNSWQDTVEHLLDFSKISSFANPVKRRIRGDENSAGTLS